MNKPISLTASRCALTAIACVFLTACEGEPFTEREKNILATLTIDKLQQPVSESNRYAFNNEAQEFGEKLFNEKGLSESGEFSCASCHDPENHFIDGVPIAVAAGEGQRNTPPLHGVAWYSWFYWDGRRDSLWSQALTPIEAPVEMAGNRVAVARFIASAPDYLTEYQSIFGPLPFDKSDPLLAISATPLGNEKQKSAWLKLDSNKQNEINTVFANVGKALAAYQHTLAPVETRFDAFQREVAEGKSVSKIDSLSKLELEGARLFLNEKKTQCVECHNGVLVGNGNFHNIGTGNFTGPVFDFGREFGAQAALLNEFNCQGKYSDAKSDECLHLIYMNRNTAHKRGAFKTPTLRNIPNTAPYFHDGRFTTLEQVVRHYAVPPPRPEEHELRPGFELTEKEIIALTAFLQSFEPLDSAK